MSANIAYLSPGDCPTAIGFQGRWQNPLSDRKRHGVGEGTAGAIRHFDADSVIYAEGDKAAACYLVVSGMVRTCRFLSDGRRQIDGFQFPGDVFGLEFGPSHRLSAEAVDECSIITYRAPYADKAGDVLQDALRALDRAREHALLLGCRCAAEKLAAFLLEIAERTASSDAIVLAMSRQDIADYLGLTIETVSRCLSQFERDGVIALSTARRIRITNYQTLRHLGAGHANL